MRRFTLSPNSEAFCQSVFEKMQGTSDAIYGVLISTVDGHDVTHRFTRDMPAAKLSAMTSSILALGETVAVEAHQKQCRYVIVENADGYILNQRIHEHLVLSVIATTDANLGMLHSICRNAAERLSAHRF